MKRWRYVGVFCEELMACAAVVRVGPFLQSFWAVHPRSDGRLRERTRLLSRRSVVLESRQLRINDSGVLLDLCIDENDGIQALCMHGREHVWTRKQAGVPARGTLVLDGGPERQVEALAVIDDTAGYHARFTEWWWSAGVGEGPDGTPLAWNLVAGVNDPPAGSERAVWVAEAPRETPPVTFDEDLSRIRCEDGSDLRFLPEAERSRRENLLIVRSDYRAPFGSFSGTLPGGIELAHGLGVVEHHRAHW
ncbi:MAG TPA: DUF2804 family protein [Solirubrobacteraceae bacterium]|nr:DUF2804 family protein [Solirubrobacteraceae bacterium]